ncbi:SDR family NAD(P)-dependent oxidoreductase [Gordonia sp. TBRC 11910]|uniref:SDR family NAD(P)-dependent oxidoreductase n=1 Tax=Gordonia asplenii TaxID=2725283 RepID=A0A848KVY2_9ACTN|nr:SDR family NAD(P)-dependent oxidoreductase [Gordonia asplenii]NMO02826.1 SDR family NAD(P)-dependent oxidoreductase [Gordonia asplenii]
MIGQTSEPVWLVTGASKGIGRDVVRAALSSGARVVAASRDPSSLVEWATAQGYAERVLAVAMDVVDEVSVAAGIEAAVDRFGAIDVVVNNAGYLLYGGVEELSADEVRRSFGVNVFGLLNVTRAVLPVMRGRRSGRVINMSSISADVTSPGTGLYSATKAAVQMLSEALDDEARDLGIRSIAVCPGGVRTDFLDASSAQRASTVIDDYTSVHRVERALSAGNHRQGGDPQRVAEVIVELATMDDPPSRIYLGRDALAAIERTEHRVLADVERYRELSESITRTGE